MPGRTIRDAVADIDQRLPSHPGADFSPWGNIGLYWGYIGVIYWDNGKQSGNYYLRFSASPGLKGMLGKVESYSFGELLAVAL